MITIGRLAKRFGLSRSTLLYYDSIGLLQPSGRSAKGYRLYSPDDAARLEQICLYRQTGLSLTEVARVLPAAGDDTLREALHRRLESLNDEIRLLRRQQKLILDLLQRPLGGRGGDQSDLDSPAHRFLDKAGWVAILRAAGLSDDEMERWHVEFERLSPEAHQDFLESLGIADDEIERIRRWSQEEAG